MSADFLIDTDINKWNTDATPWIILKFVLINISPIGFVNNLK